MSTGPPAEDAIDQEGAAIEIIAEILGGRLAKA